MATTDLKGTFFALVRAGLWEQDVRLLPFGEVDYNEVMRLAEEQSVVGLITAGMEHIADTKAPKTVALTLIGSSLKIEERNKAMNYFIENLVSKMRMNGVHTLLVKGQGIAQCYERPLWRSSGDVDLFLDEENYIKAKALMESIAELAETEGIQTKHAGYLMGPWKVELHGTLRCELTNRMDKSLDEVQDNTFSKEYPRIWNNNGIDIFLPNVNDDVIFVFTHFLKHFFKGGICIRQICDWCRLLWTNKAEIDVPLLEKRLKQMGLMSEWKVFASLSVTCLGMPEEAMPLHSSQDKYYKKANKIMAFILKSKSNKSDCQNNKQIFVRKTRSMLQHTCEILQHFSVFPMDSLRIWGTMIRTGITAA